MKSRGFTFYLLLLAIGALTQVATPAFAVNPQWDSYAAKFICNAQNVRDDVVVFGKYRTMVNIHNPHYLTVIDGIPVPLQFFKKVVLSKSQDEPPLPPSCFHDRFLEADGATGIDCDDIKVMLTASGLPTGGDLQGFLVLLVPPFQGDSQSSPPALDVVSVYTARPRNGIDVDTRKYDVKALEVERVEPVKVIGTPSINLCHP